MANLQNLTKPFSNESKAKCCQGPQPNEPQSKRVGEPD